MSGSSKSYGIFVRGNTFLRGNANVSASSGAVTAAHGYHNLNGAYGFRVAIGKITVENGAVTGNSSAAHADSNNAGFSVLPHDLNGALPEQPDPRNATYTGNAGGVRYEAPDAKSGIPPAAVTCAAGETSATVSGNTGALSKELPGSAVPSTFTGWSTSKTGGTLLQAGDTVDVAAGQTVVLYAQWEAEEYTVTLYLNGGEGESTINYMSGTGVTLPTPVKTGHSFGGWYDNEDLTGVPVTEISAADSGDKEFYAKWSVAMPVFDTGVKSFEGYVGEAFQNETIARATAQGGAVTYSLKDAPDGVTINAETGAISVAGTLAAGNYSFTISVVSKLDPIARAEKTVSLKIIELTIAMPEFVNTIKSMEGIVGEEFDNELIAGAAVQGGAVKYSLRE